MDGAHSSDSQNSVFSAPAVKVPVRIEDVEFRMEIDTGAAASILSYADYERYFKYLALRPVERSFHAYAGTPLNIAGQILVDVEHNGQRATQQSPSYEIYLRKMDCQFTVLVTMGRSFAAKSSHTS